MTGKQPPLAPLVERSSRFVEGTEPLGFSADAGIATKQTVRLLPDNAMIWLYLTPQQEHKRFAAEELVATSSKSGKPLTPIYWGNANHAYAQDGFGAYVREGEIGETRSVAFAFEDGSVLAVDRKLLHLDDMRIINFSFLARIFWEAFDTYLAHIRALGFVAPVLWKAGVTGVITRHFNPSDNEDRAGLPSFLADSVESGGMVPSSESGRSALKPLFDDLFHVCGLASR